MNADAKVKIEVDTRKAKADLKELHRAKASGRKKVGAVAKRTSSMATRAFAFTGGAAVLGKFNGASSSGNVDIFDEALVPIYAAAQSATDKAVGFSAAGRRTARERTKAAFAYHVGKTGEMAGAREFYKLADASAQDQESGRNLLRQDPRFIGPDIGEVSTAALKGHTKLFLKNLYAVNPLKLLLQGFDYVVTRLAS
jgi:hypothetical protein